MRPLSKGEKAIDDLVVIHEESMMGAYIKGLERGARDVCMYCGGEAPGFYGAEGPNSAGNWTHAVLPTNQRPGDNKRGPVLCVASAIHARINYLRAAGGDDAEA